MKPKGHYGVYGGQYVAETLMGPLQELERAYGEAKADAAFQQEFHDILRADGTPFSEEEVRIIKLYTGK